MIVRGLASGKLVGKLRNMKFFCGILTLLFLASIQAYAGPISVSDTQGRSMEVEVLAYTESSGNLKIKRSDGQVFNVKIDIFDSESQEKIKANAPKAKADLIIRVSVGKRRSRQGDSSYMKDQTISASVAIKNDSRDIDFPEGKGTLFLIARQTKRYADDSADYGKVLSKQSFPVSTLPGKSMEFEAEPIVTSYDSDRDSSNIGGWEYYGYLFILEDGDGDIHSVDTSIGNLKKDVETYPAAAKKLLSLTANQLVEKNLSKR